MIEILDTAGQEEYNALRDQWIRDGEGFILVYSTTDRSSFENIQPLYNNVLRVKFPEYLPPTEYGAGKEYESQSPPAPSRLTVPAMLVGNKKDLIRQRVVDHSEGANLAKSLGCRFVETSAPSQENVDAAFFDVVRILIDQQTPKDNGNKKFSGRVKKAAHTTRDGNAGSARHAKKSMKHRACAIL